MQKGHLLRVSVVLSVVEAVQLRISKLEEPVVLPKAPEEDREQVLNKDRRSYGRSRGPERVLRFFFKGKHIKNFKLVEQKGFLRRFSSLFFFFFKNLEPLRISKL